MPAKKTTSECEECGLVLLRSNLNRHLQSHHPQRRFRSSSASATLQCRAATVSERSSVQSAANSMEPANSVADHSVAAHSGVATFSPVLPQAVRNSSLSLEECLMASAASASLIEQHHIYGLEGLCNYLAEHFPSVPAAARPYLVVGATAGAQHAAQIHYLVDAHRMAQELEKREIARNAKCSLSNWVLGLRNQPSRLNAQVRDSILQINRQEVPTVSTGIPYDPLATGQSAALL